MRRTIIMARLDTLDETVVDERAVRDLGARVGAREQLLRALHRGQEHVDRHIAIGVTVHLDARAMHLLNPGVELVLGLCDVALVIRSVSRIRLA